MERQMSQKLTMRKTREILRLRWSLNRSHREIAASVGVGSSTVGDCLARAKRAGLKWPLDDSLDDVALEERLYANTNRKVDEKDRQFNWPHIQQELSRKGVTLQLLWSEYNSHHPDGLNYSRYCDIFRAWRSQVDVCMRQTHKAGEKMYVDYAGMTIPIINSRTGEIHQAEIFVAALGASNYTFAEATLTQSLPDWIGSHVRAFAFFNGVPEIVVPDNLKSGVTHAHRYEPDINLTYLDMSGHYNVAVIPARARMPKDKAKVEEAVQHVERKILATFRDRQFFSVHELNEAIKPLLESLNDAPFQKLPGSRREQFEALDKPELRPLPTEPYEFAECKKVRLGLDYHVEVDGHYYSAPYMLAKKELVVRLTSRTVEVLFSGKRVASHIRSNQKRRHTTCLDHMPRSHREYAEWTPERIVRWAGSKGEFTAKLAEKIMESRQHPEQGFRSCMGLIRLEKKYGENRLNAVCRRALVIQAHNYKSVESILNKNLDQLPLPEPDTFNSVTAAMHENVRGGDYFT
jgi:transposase